MMKKIITLALASIICTEAVYPVFPDNITVIPNEVDRVAAKKIYLQDVCKVTAGLLDTLGDNENSLNEAMVVVDGGVKSLRRDLNHLGAPKEQIDRAGYDIKKLEEFKKHLESRSFSLPRCLTQSCINVPSYLTENKSEAVALCCCCCGTTAGFLSRNPDIIEKTALGNGALGCCAIATVSAFFSLAKYCWLGVKEEKKD